MNDCYHIVFICESGKLLIGNSFPIKGLAETKLNNISKAMDHIQESLEDLSNNLPIIKTINIVEDLYKIVKCIGIKTITDDELNTANIVYSHSIVDRIVTKTVLTEEELLHRCNKVYIVNT